jgi:hypothetical protein
MEVEDEVVIIGDLCIYQKSKRGKIDFIKIISTVHFNRDENHSGFFLLLNFTRYIGSNTNVSTSTLNWGIFLEYSRHFGQHCRGILLGAGNIVSALEKDVLFAGFSLQLHLDCSVLPLRLLLTDSTLLLYYNRGIFVFYFIVPYSTLHHIPRLRFHRCWTIKKERGQSIHRHPLNISSRMWSAAFSQVNTQSCRLEIANFLRTLSHVGIFDPALWSVLSPVSPVPFSLVQHSPLPCVNNYRNRYGYSVQRGEGPQTDN